MKRKRHENLLQTQRLAEDIPDPVARLRFLRAQMKPNRPVRSYNSVTFVMSLLVSMLFTSHAAAPPVHSAGAISGEGLVSTAPAVRVQEASQIWPVEQTSSFESYSNGLRIDNTFAVANHPRSYVTFSVRTGEADAQRSTIPAGIVFHTTESLQIPFEPEKNAALRRVAQSLVAYVSRRRAYNFVVDRFGRVYRVVRETDAANHAGNSVWSDSERVYLNLNDSFLGIALESHTEPGQVQPEVSSAQIWSTFLLTEMLRQRYQIPAEDCVTHGQISVNASGMLVGYHMDWASGFSFDRLGLPDNYGLPLPAVYLFGFGYDSNFARRAGARLLQEAEQGEQILRERAAADGMDVSAYRKAIRKTYLKQWTRVREDRAGRRETFEDDGENSGAATEAAQRSE